MTFKLRGYAWFILAVAAVSWRSPGQANLLLEDQDRAKWPGRAVERFLSIVEYNKLIEANPANIDAYWCKAEMNEANTNYDGAVADYAKLIELTPQKAAAYALRGTLEIKTGNNDRAIADFNKAIELSPGYPLARKRRAEAKKNKRDYEGAIADYTRLIEEYPTNREAYYGRAESRELKGDADGAKADHQKAREQPYTFLSSEWAIADCTQMIEADALNLGAYDARGACRKDLGDYEGAIADYTTVIELSPYKHSKVVGYHCRGNVKLQKGDNDGAIADFDTVLKMSPGHVFTYVYRGDAK